MTEFKVTEFKYWFSSKPVSPEMESHLNEMSAEGWSLVEIISSVGLFEFPNYVRYVWKRER